MKSQFLTLSFVFIAFTISSAANNYFLLSPDERIQVWITSGEQITYSILVDGQEILNPSAISMTLSDGKILGAKPRVSRSSQRTVNNMVDPGFENAPQLRDHFNELTLRMRDRYALIFRAYNEGVAYRFSTEISGDIQIANEEVNFNFNPDTNGYYIEVESFENSYEDNYKYQPISRISPNSYAILPLLVEASGGIKVLLTEADLLDYPGVYLVPSENGLRGAIPAYPKHAEVGGDRNFNVVVKERENFIARTKGTRTFPWRVSIIAHEDKELLHNHLVYLLSTPSRLPDVSWIQPGKVAWDWWNALNLSGVDFRTGFNTETYKYFIDFAAKNGIEYVNLDEGWSNQFDLMEVATELDMPEVINYAQQKNVKLILWCIWHVLDRQMQEALNQFTEWGIAGVKVDFMDRDDQVVVNFYERLAVETAKRNLIVNFHGAYKPTGLRRTYPNVINREAVMGLEYLKWSDKVTPEHNVTIPFIRMAVGPMDYTPGAMRNAAIGNFQPIFENPMSMGTRCHQLAMFVAYDAPLQMLADAPTAYEQEPEVLEYLAKVPTVWDETRVIDGKIGDYLIMARRKGDTWYLAAMTDGESREISVSLDFLNEGSFKADIFVDGMNADRQGQDYRKLNKNVDKNTAEEIRLAPGGGWVSVITPGT
ncbi:glycoside hydrolase family 97 protein [soil metagenome]